MVLGLGGGGAGAFAVVVGRDELGEGDVGWAADGPGGCRVEDSEVAAAGAAMAGDEAFVVAMYVVGGAGYGCAVCASRCTYVAIFVACLEEYASLLGTIWRWRRERARDGGETPLLDVGLDEDEAGLSEVDVDDSWADGADGWEEVGRFETVDDLLEFLAVAGEEDGARAGTVAHADYVALDKRRAVVVLAEWLVVAAVAGGLICDGVFVEACTVSNKSIHIQNKK